MNDIELIKSKLDIVEVIGSYVKDLKKAGANYKAKCPFHNEKTASFTVNPSLQIYKCFGCGKAGDVINFIQEIERLDFPDALRIAAQKAGVTLSDSKDFEKNSKTNEERRRLVEANTLAVKFYNYLLISHSSGKAGRDYAAKRKIDSQRIKDFMIGYATSSRGNLKKFLLTKGFKEEELVKWGLLVERDKTTIDKFRERLLQPISNLKGEIIGFSGRYIGTSKEAPKYLNSPETLIYKKNEILYGLYQAKNFINKIKDKYGQSFLIIVEGNIDILSSNRVGFGNIVAPLGTAFTLNQAKLIKRYVDELFFCFDTDQAGIKALVRGVALAEEVGLKHKVIDIKGYQDADELICKKPEEWKKRIQSAKSSVDYLIEKFSEDLDLGSVEGKSNFSLRIMPVLKSLKDEVLISHYIKQVAIILEVDEQIIINKLNNTRIDSEVYNIKESMNKINNISNKSKPSPTRKLEAYLLSLLIQTDNLFKVELKAEYFQDDICRSIYIELFKAGHEADFGFIAENLADEEKLLLEEVIMTDTSKIRNPDKEVTQIYTRFYKIYLKNEILKLRREMARNINNEDEVMNKLSVLIKELKNVQ